MAFRIKPPPAQIVGKGPPQKKPDYLAWIHTLPCVATGQMGVEAAHVSFQNLRYGAIGRGKGRKVADRWVVPLRAECHATQHTMNEEDFWWSVGIDPHEIALVLFGIWTEFKDTPEANQLAVGAIRERLHAKG